MQLRATACILCIMKSLLEPLKLLRSYSSLKISKSFEPLHQWWPLEVQRDADEFSGLSNNKTLCVTFVPCCQDSVSLIWLKMYMKNPCRYPGGKMGGRGQNNGNIIVHFGTFLSQEVKKIKFPCRLKYPVVPKEDH